ncbi:hypothetical protein ACGLHS_07180 [Variovorax sp. VaC1]|uniref:hypothetical protein n=1 Tax=Variovorax sp. VaC1 TaxID=3373132 RepID=UPI003749ACCC
MATTPQAGPAPASAASVNSRLELSGRKWVSRFPTGTSTNDLTPVFRRNTNDFIAAIESAGGSVRISATFRPKERAYLMHYAAAIANGSTAADRVPAMPGVDIEWDHGSAEKSRAAAREMASGYDIVYPPALASRHTERSAIDMTISGVKNKKIKNASGVEVLIQKDSDLHAVGATYGVKKLVSDPPHWSDNGF